MRQGCTRRHRKLYLPKLRSCHAPFGRVNFLLETCGASLPRASSHLLVTSRLCSGNTHKVNARDYWRSENRSRRLTGELQADGVRRRMCEGPLFKYAHHTPRRLGTAAHHPSEPFRSTTAKG